MVCTRVKFFMLFNKTIRMYYSLFVFRFYYKIIGLSFKKLAGRGLPDHGLTRQWPLTVWVEPGPGMGLNSSLWVWVGLGLTKFCLDSNC